MIDPAGDFSMKIPMSMARRLYAAMTPQDEDYFRMQVAIKMGEGDQERKLKVDAEIHARDEARKAAELAKPLSQRGSKEECGIEFNRCRRLYNFQWQHEFDLTSMGGLIITAYDGTWVGTSTKQCPQQLLEIVEHGIKEGLFGEPFEGPLYEHTDEDEE